MKDKRENKERKTKKLMGKRQFHNPFNPPMTDDEKVA